MPAPKREQGGEEIFDNPTGWVAKHLRGCAETNGEKGHLYHGMPALLLTARGHRSGKQRRTALIYGRDGDRYVLVASNAGVPRPPSWHLDPVEHPDVAVQVGPDKFFARARTVTAMRPHLWRQMASIFPQYDVYRKKASRDFSAVIVERAG